ncbi:unnamed protein product, partial [marine sediment metagenome]
EGIELVVVLHPIPPSETSHPSFFVMFFYLFLLGDFFENGKVFVLNQPLLFRL